LAANYAGETTLAVTHVLEALAANLPSTFLSLDEMNGASFGAVDITGTSPVWEMHPDTDEFFYVIEGHLELTLREATGDSTRELKLGSMSVIPRGVWHLPSAPDGARFIYYTPGETRHADEPPMP
jgi:mannose-6-phosphate isomerase-like protein (cupin superfamily)